MAKKPLIYLVYNDLVNAVNGIGKKTFLDRPKNSTEDLANFVVVDLPTELRGRVKGDINFTVDSYGTFSIFCKAKTDSTPNISIQTELTQKVLDVFPINGKHITASKPSVLMQGEDGYGYHVTQITFKLRTKLNARDII